MNIDQIKVAKHINLEELLIMLDEDIVLIEKLLNEFVKTSPIDIQNLNLAIIDNNYSDIALIAHKLKSNFKNFGIASSQEMAAIETLAKGKEPIKIIEALLSEINKDYTAAINEAMIILG